MRKRFLNYVIPSIFALAVVGLYSIADGFFVGNGVGDDGLAAVGLAYPIAAILDAAGTGIGMGGAILYTINDSAGDHKKAAKITRCTITILLLFSALCTILVLLFTDPILCAVGAGGDVLSYGRIYLRILFIGSVFQTFGAGLPPLIRNHNDAAAAMRVMVLGCLCNIILDYFFVLRLDMGTAGAAWATVLGQGIGVAGGIYFFIRRKISVLNPYFDMGMAAGIFRAGISSFGITLCPSVSLFLMNRFAVTYGGFPAVTTYAIISYLTWIVYLVLEGTADGCQPLFSECTGRGDSASFAIYKKMGYSFAVLMGVLSTAALFFPRKMIGPVFGASPEVSASVAAAMPILLVGFIPLAFARIITAGFYAAAKAGTAALITYAESALLLIFLLILPHCGPLLDTERLTMVWISMPVSQILTAFLAVGIELCRRRGNSERWNSSGSGPAKPGLF